ncbi:nucleoid-associated protein [Snodgrassella sp. CFCC 13594]|uniref:nucleoid-associated protein n=1 Tax=Snodgrassella sp. CFCC 13594 TaxID=1775559 RepID=UPI00082A9E50|nr:nucleoid-associated protein [Snodgrassella sp. CFCC 13594]
MHLNNVVIHKLVIEKNLVTIDLANEEAGNDAEVTNEFLDGLLAYYEKRVGKSYGHFESDTVNYPASVFLQQWYIDKKTNFIQTTKNFMAHLQNRAPHTSASANIVFFCVTENGKDLLLISVVNNKKGAAIENRDFKRTQFLDLKEMRFAGKVDLTAWKNQDENYISFLAGGSDVSNFFQQFLGCNSSIRSKTITIALTELVGQFSQDKEMSPERILKFYADSHEYLKNLTEENPFNAEVFSRTVYPEAPEDIQDYMNKDEYKIPDGFSPHKATVDTLNTVTFTENAYTLKIRRDAIIRGNAYYDEDMDAVILRNPSKKMKAEFTVQKNDNDSPEN